MFLGIIGGDRFLLSGFWHPPVFCQGCRPPSRKNIFQILSHSKTLIFYGTQATSENEEVTAIHGNNQCLEIKLKSNKLTHTSDEFKFILSTSPITYADLINDSKSTNGDSTAAALKSFSNIFWIVGGKPKNDGIGKAKNFLNKVVEVFLIGNSTNYFSKEILKFNENTMKLNEI